MNNGNLGKVDLTKLATLGGGQPQQPQRHKRRRNRHRATDRLPDPPAPVVIDQPAADEYPTQAEIAAPVEIELIEPAPLPAEPPEARHEAAPPPAPIEPASAPAPSQDPAPVARPRRGRKPKVATPVALPAVPLATLPDQPLSWSQRCHRYLY